MKLRKDGTTSPLGDNRCDLIINKAKRLKDLLGERRELTHGHRGRGGGWDELGD